MGDEVYLSYKPATKDLPVLFKKKSHPKLDQFQLCHQSFHISFREVGLIFGGFLFLPITFFRGHYITTPNHTWGKSFKITRDLRCLILPKEEVEEITKYTALITNNYTTIYGNLWNPNRKPTRGPFHDPCLLEATSVDLTSGHRAARWNCISQDVSAAVVAELAKTSSAVPLAEMIRNTHGSTCLFKPMENTNEKQIFNIKGIN